MFDPKQSAHHGRTAVVIIIVIVSLNFEFRHLVQFPDFEFAIGNIHFKVFFGGVKSLDAEIGAKF